MIIPKIIKKNNNIYLFEKQYPNYFLYKNAKTKTRECFYLSDIVNQKNENRKKPSKWEKNRE